MTIVFFLCFPAFGNLGRNVGFCRETIRELRASVGNKKWRRRGNMIFLSNKTEFRKNFKIADSNIQKNNKMKKLLKALGGLNFMPLRGEYGLQN